MFLVSNDGILSLSLDIVYIKGENMSTPNDSERIEMVRRMVGIMTSELSSVTELQIENAIIQIKIMPSFADVDLAQAMEASKGWIR